MKKKEKLRLIPEKGGGDELALYMLYLPKIFNYFQVQVRLSMF